MGWVQKGKLNPSGRGKEHAHERKRTICAWIKVDVGVSRIRIGDPQRALVVEKKGGGRPKKKERRKGGSLH